VVGGRRAQRVLGWATAVGMAGVCTLALAVVPPDATQGDVQRLRYVHVPAAWLAFASFGVVFVASVAYLRTDRVHWDRIAVSSAEIGVLFCALTIVLGSLWGPPVWGTWWTWDPRLTTTAVLLLIYVGYLTLRRVADNPTRRARWSAVVGIVGFADVPIVHMSVVWWRSLHQEATVLRPGAPTIAGSMLATLLAALAVFTVAYTYLMVVRLRATTSACATSRRTPRGRHRPSSRSSPCGPQTTARCCCGTSSWPATSPPSHCASAATGR
jgi:heme exporter protein C